MVHSGNDVTTVFKIYNRDQVAARIPNGRLRNTPSIITDAVGAFTLYPILISDGHCRLTFSITNSSPIDAIVLIGSGLKSDLPIIQEEWDFNLFTTKELAVLEQISDSTVLYLTSDCVKVGEILLIYPVVGKFSVVHTGSRLKVLPTEETNQECSFNLEFPKAGTSRVLANDPRYEPILEFKVTFT